MTGGVENLHGIDGLGKRYVCVWGANYLFGINDAKLIIFGGLSGLPHQNLADRSAALSFRISLSGPQINGRANDKNMAVCVEPPRGDSLYREGSPKPLDHREYALEA